MLKAFKETKELQEQLALRGELDRRDLSALHQDLQVQLVTLDRKDLQVLLARLVLQVPLDLLVAQPLTTLSLQRRMILILVLET